MSGTPNGIRTHVSALRGRRPRPLDNGGKWLGNKDLNLDNTSQSRRCCRYTIPQCPRLRGPLSIAKIIIANPGAFVKGFFQKSCRFAFILIRPAGREPIPRPGAEARYRYWMIRL